MIPETLNTWSMYGERGTVLSKGKLVNRLGTQLAMAAVCCALAAALLFLVLENGACRLLDHYLLNEDVTREKEEACIKRLQSYITQHSLSSGQVKSLDQWMEKERYLIVTVYSQERVIYSSDSKMSTYSADIDMTAISNMPWSYEVQFADGPARVVLIYFFESFYYTAADGISAVLSVVFFVILLFACIRRKMRYIALLEQELKILKGGDLDYPVTVRGNDELASLAREIDGMRCAIKQRMEKEEEARQANRELVTAMSHDLRTPLTSLLGYVDILYMGKFQDEEQRLRCTGALRQKAYQIRELSDKLFEYFIVYGKEQETLDQEVVNGAEFLGQVVEESLFDLESEGFVVCRTTDEINCRLLVDVGLVRRVFGNIFSNLLKYGDRASPVFVVYRQQCDTLAIHFTNTVSPDVASRESSGIGLKTCRKIMKDHGGNFQCSAEGKLFETEVMFKTESANV